MKFLSFPSHPLPTLLLAPFFARSLALVPRSLLIACVASVSVRSKSQAILKVIVTHFESELFICEGRNSSRLHFTTDPVSRTQFSALRKMTTRRSLFTA